MCNRSLLLAIMLMLTSCHEDKTATEFSKPSKSAEAMRIEKEVAKRVKAVKKEVANRVEVVTNDLKVGQTRLHTIRVVGFIMLAGGAVAALVWVRQPRFPDLPMRPASRQRALLPQWTDHYPPPAGRVIELSGTRPTPQPNPGRRKSRRPNHRHRHHHETPRHP